MKIDFSNRPKKKEQILNNVNTIVARHNVSNIFLKIKKSEVLKFGIIVKKK